jgi:glycosyltransferase involved in cell wall biosynthesis
MKNNLFIYAPNINSGGGLVLLQDLINLNKNFFNIEWLIDEEIANNFKNNHFHIVSPGVFRRIKAEIYLKNKVNRNDVVLFFSNLPPLFKLKGLAIVFVQNRFVLDRLIFNTFNAKLLLKLIIQKIIFILFHKNASKFLVQSESMYLLLKKITQKEINIAPFISMPIKNIKINREMRKKTSLDKIRFIYVANFEKHKNHINLIAAWSILYDQNIQPKLTLTLANEEIYKLKLELSKRYISIPNNINFIDMPLRSKFMNEFSNHDVLIYPSKIESYGLPLIEAQILNMPIIASELDYVRDIVKPNESFDPNSARSIARAVKRYLNVSEKSAKVISSEDFLNFFLRVIN